MAIGQELADYALAFSFENLSDREVHAAKRVLIDMLACAIGAYQSDSSKIVRAVVEEQGGVPESTVIGSGTRVPCANAALANGAMVRYLDYNDTYFKSAGKLRLGIHPNELIPAALAVGERGHSSGKEVITAIVLAYDLAAKFVDASSARPLESIGWHYSTIAGFIVSLYTGKLLGLSREQLAHAVGIAGVHSATLGIIDAAGEAYNMTKNIGLPHVAHGGITAALLAQKGFTGPARVIEGNKGFVHTIMSGRYDLDILTAGKRPSAILETDQKKLAAEHTTQGALNAVLQLVKEYDLRPEQIDRVKLETTTRTAEHTGDVAKRYPDNKETADHSLYYLTAIAIIDRAVGPGQYTTDRLTSPRVRSLIDKVMVEANPDLDDFIFAGIAYISTTDGRELQCRVEYPKGNSRNPMSDEELIEKFQEVALQLMNKERAKQITDSVFRLDKLSDIGSLMTTLSFV